MKKFLAKAAIAFLVAGSVSFVGAGAASATEQEICVPSEAWTEVVPDIEHEAVTHEVHHDAVYEEIEVSPAVEYQPAVYEIEYEFRHKHEGKKTKWSTNPNWNAENNEHSKGWYATGNTRNGELISAEVPAQEAVYENRLVKDAWVEVIIDKEAYTEVVPDIEHPAVVCPPIEEPEEPEEPVVLPANPTAVITATCGEAFLLLTNPIIKDANQLTASFVVSVDGDFYGAYSTEVGMRGEIPISFPENSGSHLIEVYQAGTSEWKLIASAEVDTDCVIPPVEEPETPVEEPEVPVEEPANPETPVTPEEPVVVTPPAAQPATSVVSQPKSVRATSSEAPMMLAQTGSDVNPLLPLGGAAMIVAGLGALFYRRFAHN